MKGGANGRSAFFVSSRVKICNDQDVELFVIIRQETIEDQEGIRQVNQLAFGQDNEASLVDSLRINARPFISLVALVDDQVVGHISFSPVTIESPKGSFNAMGLAPMSVRPEYQNRGIGSKLVREGLNQCARIGETNVVVLGHPNYYPRFGFVPASRKGLRCEYDVADEVFMVLELAPNSLAGRTGLVKYHPDFSQV